MSSALLKALTTAATNAAVNTITSVRPPVAPTKSKNASTRRRGRTRKAPSRSKSGNVNAIGGANPNLEMSWSTAPTAIAPGINGWGMGFSFGTAQKNIDNNCTGGALRVYGSCLAAIISTASSGTGIIDSGGDNFFLSPLNLAKGSATDRLPTLSQLFDWYAFRKVRLTYVPATSSTSYGAIAIGFQSDATEAALASYSTFDAVLNSQNAVSTAVWRPISHEFANSGTKTWACYLANNSSTNMLYYQGGYVGNSLGLGPSATYGYLVAQYVIDLYGMSPNFSDPSLPRERGAKVISLSDRVKALEEFTDFNCVSTPKSEVSVIATDKVRASSSPPTSNTRR